MSGVCQALLTTNLELLAVFSEIIFSSASNDLMAVVNAFLVTPSLFGWLAKTLGAYVEPPFLLTF